MARRYGRSCRRIDRLGTLGHHTARSVWAGPSKKREVTGEGAARLFGECDRTQARSCAGAFAKCRRAYVTRKRAPPARERWRPRAVASTIACIRCSGPDVCARDLTRAIIATHFRKPYASKPRCPGVGDPNRRKRSRTGSAREARVGPLLIRRLWGAVVSPGAGSRRQSTRPPLHPVGRGGERSDHRVPWKLDRRKREQYPDQRDDEWRHLLLRGRRSRPNQRVQRPDLRRARTNARAQENADRRERELHSIQHAARHSAQLTGLQLHAPGHRSTRAKAARPSKTSSSRCARRST